MVDTQTIRIRLKSFDHKLIDASTEEIVETVKRTDDTIKVVAELIKQGNKIDLLIVVYLF